MSAPGALTGRQGERAAARYYLAQGYRLLEHNYRTRQGELDLVLMSPEREVVICEVKTRSRPAGYGGGAAAVDIHKQRRIILAARHCLQAKGLLDYIVRFDVAEVTPLDSGRWMVHIIKNAFECE